MSNLVLSKKFICTDSEFGTAGHNKFWSIKVYDDGTLETEYGRVGDSGASTTKNFGSSDAALKEAEKLIKKKERGKAKGGKRDSCYKEVDIVGTVDHVSMPSKKSLGKDVWKKIGDGNKEVENLISLLDRENIHNITSNTTLKYDETTGLFSTPLGVVGQNSIDQARLVLSNIKPFVEKNQFNNKSGDRLAEEFMMLIPQDIGRQRPTLKTLCHDLNKFDQISSILDSLQASLDVLNAPKDSKDEKKEELDFGVRVGLLEDKKEFDRLLKFFLNTKNDRHSCRNLSMKKVYTVHHKKMNEEYKHQGLKIGNVRELWHGTRIGNILSILAKGLYIPPSSASYCTGRMFGDGAYFSDQSTKSLNYSYGYWSGSRSSHCFMFLFDVAMGKEYTPTNRGFRKLPDGYDSCFAKAGVSGVLNNEMIVYKIHQCNPKYLIEFN